MLKALTIKDNEKFLRQISSVVDFEDKDLAQNLKDIKEYCTANGGLYAMACIQLGIPKRYFVVVNEYDEGQFETYVMINPRMISNSVEKIYVDQGEGCLSVNRPVDGIIPNPYGIIVTIIITVMS